jgi:hypothetical protein
MDVWLKHIALIAVRGKKLEGTHRLVSRHVVDQDESLFSRAQ